MKNQKAFRNKTGEVKPTRHFSKRQEDAVAKSLGGHRQSNSGATPFAKGDVALENFLLECKTKTKPSSVFSIKKEWLEKTEKEALFMGKPHTALVFNFGPEERNFYVLSEETFKALLGGIK